MTKPRFNEGQRLTVWIWGVQKEEILVVPLQGMKLLADLIDRIGMKPAGSPAHWVTVPGYSCWLPVLESHIGMETWPEDKAVVIDIMSCKPFPGHSAEWFLLQELKAGVLKREMSGGKKGFFEYPME